MPKSPVHAIGAYTAPRLGAFTRFLRFHASRAAFAARRRTRDFADLDGRVTKCPRRSSDRNSFGTNLRGARRLRVRRHAMRGRKSGCRSPLVPASHSLMNGAVFELSVTGLAHFVMRCDIAAPRPRANSLILLGRVPPLTIIFAMPPDGISIANPKAIQGGASLTWELGGDDLRPGKIQPVLRKEGVLQATDKPKRSDFFRMHPGKKTCAPRFRGGGENAQTQAGELR